MKIYKALLLWVLILSSIPAISQNKTFTKGKVIGVVDGDTITILLPDSSQRLIHLTGVDAPEKEQGSGRRCAENLNNALLNKTVVVRVIRQSEEGYVVGKITFKDQDFSVRQLESGCGWYESGFAEGADQSDLDSYQSAEHEAKQRSAGLWVAGLPAPLPPKEYRRLRAHARAQAIQTSLSGNRERILLNVPEHADINDHPVYSDGSSDADSSDKTIHVREYTRKDGTHVDSYNRRPPSSGRSRRY